MNSKNQFGIIASSLAGLLLAVACVPNINAPTEKNNDQKIEINNQSESKTVVKGKVDYSSGFSVKAVQSDIQGDATVSIIRASDGVTIATGLTKSNGDFTVNPSTSFSPTNGSVYILEASKRVAKTLLTLRTYIKWNGTSWDSTTTPTIYINALTTAVSIIAKFNKDVSGLDTIGKVSVSNGVSTPSDIKTVTSAKINEIANLSKKAMMNDNDPVASLDVDANGMYFINISRLAPINGVQIDRMGLPAINTVFNSFNGFTKTLGVTQAVGDAATNKFNSESPGTDNANYKAGFSAALQGLFARTKADADGIADALLPDVLPIDTTQVSGFLNGRKLADDVIDAELQLLSGLNGQNGKAKATDLIDANDKTFTTTFPFLASPH